MRQEIDHLCAALDDRQGVSQHVHGTAATALLWQVGAHDTEGAKARVVNEILMAIKGACEACVRQEKEERDGILANIQQAKVRMIMIILLLLSALIERCRNSLHCGSKGTNAMTVSAVLIETPGEETLVQHEANESVVCTTYSSTVFRSSGNVNAVQSDRSTARELQHKLALSSGRYFTL